MSRRPDFFRPCVLLALLLLTAAASLPVPTAHAQKAAKPLTLSAVENRILIPAYVDSLEAATWAAQQGPRAVPFLEKLVAQHAVYEKRAEQKGDVLGAFPFNAVWALGRIPGKEAAAALSRLASSSDTSVRPMVVHALAAHRLRAAKGTGYGVYARGQTASLYAAPSGSAKVVKTLRPGQAVHILRERIENPKEEGPRGGPTAFDYVEVLPGGPKGYIERAGDGFTPFY